MNWQEWLYIFGWIALALGLCLRRGKAHHELNSYDIISALILKERKSKVTG